MHNANSWFKIGAAIAFASLLACNAGAAVPGITFTICGSSPTPEVTALGRLPGVTVTGRVPSVIPYLNRAVVAVVPLRIGRGVQNKLLEAMAAGLPVVATTTARTGVAAENGRDVFVADDPTDFAGAVVRLLRGRLLRETVGRAARAVVEARYSWDRTLLRLEEILSEAAAGRARPAAALVGSEL